MILMTSINLLDYYPIRPRPFNVYEVLKGFILVLAFFFKLLIAKKIERLYNLIYSNKSILFVYMLNHKMV